MNQDQYRTVSNNNNKNRKGRITLYMISSMYSPKIITYLTIRVPIMFYLPTSSS